MTQVSAKEAPDAVMALSTQLIASFQHHNTDPRVAALGTILTGAMLLGRMGMPLSNECVVEILAIGHTMGEEAGIDAMGGNSTIN